MGDLDTVANISITNDGLSGGKQVSDVLKDIVKQADQVNEALDSQGLDNFNKSLENISTTMKGLASQKQQDQQRSRGLQKGATFNSLTGTAGNMVSQAGAGNVAGAGEAGMSSVLGLLKGAGPIIAGIAGAALVTAVTGNKLADEYKGRAIPSSMLATLEGGMGTNVSKNDKALQDAMQSTVDSVAKYGKTFEEGAKAREQFLRAGGQNYSSSRAGAYSLAFGSDMGKLSAFEGQTQRYGQKGGLNLASSLLKSQGLGVGQFDEVMGGIQETFNSFLSKGIVKPLEDITRSQEYFSRAGDTFKGSLGSQRMQGLNQVIAGAGRLGNQDDIFAYRSAQEMTDGSIWDTRKQLEQGMTPEMFKGLIKQYEEFGFNREQQMVKFSNYTGLGATSTEEMFGLLDQDALTKEQMNQFLKSGVPKGQGRTTVTGEIESVENIKQNIISTLGKSALELRASVIEKGDETVQAIRDLGGRPKETLFDDYGEPEKTTISEIVNNSVSQRESSKNEKSLAKSVKLARGKMMHRPGLSQQTIDDEFMPAYQSAMLSGGLSKEEKGSLENLLEKLLLELIEATNKTTEEIKKPILEFSNQPSPTTGFVRGSTR